MASRLSAIRTLVEAHITSAVAGVTIGNDPVAFDTIPKNQFPFARVIFDESEPELLAFKQERRNVTGQVVLGFLHAGGTATDTREAVDAAMEAIRDLIFADDTLTDTVDAVVVESAQSFTQADDEIAYGSLDITTEEIF